MEPDPERCLELSTLVNAFGNGLYLAGGAVFLVRSAGLSPAEVGAGFGVGGVVGLATSVLAAERADRGSLRRGQLLSLALEGVAAAALLVVHGVWVFAVVAGLAALGRQVSRALRAAYIGLLVGPERRTRVRARLRAVVNAGIAVGALAAGAVLAIDRTWAYDAMILTDAATFAVAIVVLLPLPELRADRGATLGGPRWVALRDRRYLTATALDAVMSLQYRVMTLAIPLWIVTRTSAPSWMPAGVMVVNTVGVVLLQVRATDGIDGAASAAVRLRRAGVTFALAWVAVAWAAGRAPGWATLLLVVGAVGHTVGEVWHAAGAFELSFALARPGAEAQHQSVYQLGMGLSDGLGAPVITALCLGWGRPGWIALGALLIAAGCAFPLLAARPALAGAAERRRPDPQEV